VECANAMKAAGGTSAHKTLTTHTHTHTHTFTLFLSHTLTHISRTLVECANAINTTGSTSAHTTHHTHTHIHTPTLSHSLSLTHTHIHTHTGGTLVECANAIKAAGGTSVSAFVTHAVFPTGWDRFSRSNGGPFENFFVTNSNPTVTNRLPSDDCFRVLDLFDVVLRDLE